MKYSTKNKLFGGFISGTSILLVLMGMALMYFAFSFVRAVAFWMLFHFAEIAFILALLMLIAVLMMVCGKRRSDP